MCVYEEPGCYHVGCVPLKSMKNYSRYLSNQDSTDFRQYLVDVCPQCGENIKHEELVDFQAILNSQSAE